MMACPVDRYISTVRVKEERKVMTEGRKEGYNGRKDITEGRK